MNNYVQTRLGLRLLWLSFFGWIVVFSVQAQDIHHSQFYNHGMHLNPALTGIFNGDMRFTGNYRSQWQSVPVGYETGFGSFDMRFSQKSSETSFFTGGLVLDFDKAGDAELGTIHVGLNGGYTKQITKRHFLSAGVQLSGYQRSFETDRLRFDEQYDGKQFQEEFFNGENFNDRTKFFGDISAGLNWRYAHGQKRTTIDGGVGLFHINEPHSSFFGEDYIVLLQKWPNNRLVVIHWANK